ncbi:3'-5' exonuclease [Pseudomonas sp. F1_0610]|uniref:3'-5' exonuclease n=1 Tax=Pseudomonas sp. F1_0610 TaxID=3114284 RepID=UPI0039C27389
MSFFSWLSKSSTLNSQQLAQIERLKQFKQRPLNSLDSQRIVVVDVETTGLNMLKDKVLSIGAVVIEKGCITLNQSFYCTLNRNDVGVTPSVLIHKISPSQMAEGLNPQDALIAFLAFIGDSPLLAFHALFDKGMLQRECKELLNFKLTNVFYDVAELAPLLMAPLNNPPTQLDEWVNYFKLTNNQRHSALADAFVTAEIALILLNKARKKSILEFSQLDHALYEKRKHLKQNFSF